MYRLKGITLILFLNFLLFINIQPVFGSDEYSAYLFTFFTGNDSGKGQESIYFAISDDAHTFKILNKEKPVLSSVKISNSGGVRDPHILRGENKDYYIVATDMVSKQGWDSNHGIVMLRSSNLIDWKSSTIDIHELFSAYKTADHVWAPQTIYDPTVKKYMVYFAMRLGPKDKDKIYYAYADSSFTKLESVPKVLYTYGNNAAIDADIIYKDSTYYLFFKTEASGNGIKSALSKKLTEGYVLYDKYLQATSSAVEGSCVFKLNNSDSYVLMYDVYTSGRYEFALSIDLKTFTKDPKPISFDFTPRHGTIIPITSAEKSALLAKWNPTAIVKERVKTAKLISHSYHGNSLNLTFGKYLANNTVVLVDLSGNTVLRQDVSGISVKMDLTMVHAGVYHVLCKTNTGVAGSMRITVK